MNTTMRRVALATAGLAAAGGLVFGVTEASAAPSAPAYASAADAVNASATGSAAGEAAAACKNTKRPRRCARRREAVRERAALFEKGAHGQNTVKDSSGAYVVREWQVGKVAAVAGSSVTVASGDGTTWTWTAQSATTVRVAGSAGTLSGVRVGDEILVRGQRSGSANDAKAIVDPDQSKLKAELG